VPPFLQEDLLLWRDPKKSAVALGGVTAIFLALQFAKINLLQSLAFTLLSLVLGCFLWNNLVGAAAVLVLRTKLSDEPHCGPA